MGRLRHNFDDEDDDSSSDEDSAGVAGLSIDSLDVCEKCENSIDSSWKVPLFNDLFNVSREAASHPSDKAGESRNMLSPDVDNIDAHKLVAEQSQLLLAFSAAGTDSEEESEDEEEDEVDPELLKSIQAEEKSRRAIEKSERSAATEFIKRSDKG